MQEELLEAGKAFLGCVCVWGGGRLKFLFLFFFFPLSLSYVTCAPWYFIIFIFLDQCLG